MKKTRKKGIKSLAILLVLVLTSIELLTFIPPLGYA